MTTKVSAAMLDAAPIPNGVGRNIQARTHEITPASQLTITADELIVKDSSGHTYLLSNVNVSPAITASGANGLDTGTEAANIWYYGWVIYNPVTNDVAGLISTSPTAPTLPTGYTHKTLVTAVRNNSSSDFLAYRQFGNKVYFASSQLAISGGSSTSEAAVSVANFVPPIALSFQLNGTISITGTNNADASTSIRHTSGSPFALADIRVTGFNGTGSHRVAFDCELPNNGQQFFYVNTVTAGGPASLSASVLGFKLPGCGE